MTTNETTPEQRAKNNGDSPATPALLSVQWTQGLTKRESIAAMTKAPDDLAMSWGELMVGPYPSRGPDGTILFDEAGIRWWMQVEARWSVMRADALLLELERASEEQQEPQA